MVVMVDEVQIEYYDSNTQRIITKQDWADQANREDPDSLERETERRKGNQQVYKGNIGTPKRRFNQTGDSDTSSENTEEQKLAPEAQPLTTVSI
ncbi:unnamed protein product [Boreogadus saida]